MNKRLTFNTKDQNVWFVGCTHYNHDPKWAVPIWKMRGFKSVEEMNREIINSINANVKPDDILFHLGDIALNCTEEQFEDFISKLMCKNIYLMFGNHPNPVYKIYKREVEKFWNNVVFINQDQGHINLKNNLSEISEFRYKNIIFIEGYKEIIVNKQLIVLSHYPIRVFNESARGSWMLHSHNHGGLDSSLPASQEGKILDVGFDIFHEPLSFKDIEIVMNRKSIKQFDRHH